MPATGVTVIDADVLHVAGVCVTTVLAGAGGAGATIIWKAGEIHPAVFLTVTLYVPAGTLLKMFNVWYPLPMEYSIPATGVTIIIANVLHVAGVCVATGLAGAVGAGATVICKAGDIHPALFLTVTL